MDHVLITHSDGYGKYGLSYVYIRPAKKCSNRSRRVRVSQVDAAIKKHFPHVNYYMVDGYTIGAKDERSALAEYRRVCEKSKKSIIFKVTLIEQHD